MRETNHDRISDRHRFGICSPPHIVAPSWASHKAESDSIYSVGSRPVTVRPASSTTAGPSGVLPRAWDSTQGPRPDLAEVDGDAILQALVALARRLGLEAGELLETHVAAHAVDQAQPLLAPARRHRARVGEVQGVELLAVEEAGGAGADLAARGVERHPHQLGQGIGGGAHLCLGGGRLAQAAVGRDGVHRHPAVVPLHGDRPLGLAAEVLEPEGPRPGVAAGDPPRGGGAHVEPLERRQDAVAGEPRAGGIAGLVACCSTRMSNTLTITLPS